MSAEETLRALEEYDTPSITNVVATFPDDPLCLGLYDPWSRDWYTDQRITCLYPDIGPRAGHAATCVYGLPDSDFDGLGFMDVIDALEDGQTPSILALEQDFPSGIAGKVGLTGGNMTSAMRAVDCVGCVMNGPARDVEEVGSMGFQYLATGVSPAHGEMAVKAVNVPVSICGMDVAPDEVIHMDGNGAVKFPADRLDDVLENVRKLEEREADLQRRVRDATSADEVRTAFAGDAYGDDEG